MPQKLAQDPPRALVLSDGNLPALLAILTEADAGAGLGARGRRPVVLPWFADPSVDALARKSVDEQARSFGLEIVRFDAGPPRVGRLFEAGPARTTLALITAVYTALEIGCERVVWPVQLGGPENLDATHLAGMAEAVDRALICARISLLDGPARGMAEVRVETPFIDLTDHQLAELAWDMDAPVQRCWWWGGDRAPDAPGGAERERWLNALRAAGWHHAGATPR